jgi:signal transduction histidine kinase
VLNIISNAIKFTDPGGHCFSADEQINNSERCGIGMSEHCARAFARDN